MPRPKNIPQVEGWGRTIEVEIPEMGKRFIRYPSDCPYATNCFKNCPFPDDCRWDDVDKVFRGRQVK